MRRRSFLGKCLSVLGLGTACGPLTASASKSSATATVSGPSSFKCVSLRANDWIVLDRMMYSLYLDAVKEFPGCLTPNSTATISTTSPQPTSTVEPPTSTKP